MDTRSAAEAKPRRLGYVPALSYHFLTPMYDVGIRFTMPEQRLKRTLLRLAGIAANSRVLDLGCGTGTLLLIGYELHPDASWVGVDPDGAVIDRARRKLAVAGARARLELGSATALPFAGASFDRVLSTLVIHHLDPNQKREAFAEILRVLRPGGEVHIADFGVPRGLFTRAASFVIEKLGHEHVEENFTGMLPSRLAAAGFQQVSETWSIATVFGMVRALRGIRP